MTLPACPCRNDAVRVGMALALGAAALFMAPAAEARITRIVVDPALSQSPTFEGRVFGPDGRVGTYEKLRGKAYGELDPADPRNASITDLDLAPRNARGKVEYSMDIFILKPSDVRKGNHKLFLDFNNRGEMRVLALNDAALSNNPMKAAEAGTGFIMNLGYSVVGNGWDFGATNEDEGLTISVPVAKNPDGSSITGPSYQYINFDNAKSVRYDLAYPAATLDKSKATLTVRARLDDQPTTLGRWRLGIRRREGHPSAACRHRVQAKPHLRVQVHGQGSGRRRGRTGGHARSRFVSPARRERRRRHPQSSRRRSCGRRTASPSRSRRAR